MSAGMSHRQTRASASASASAGAAAEGADMGKMLERSFINSTPARLVAVVAAIAVGGASTSLLPGTGLAIAHVMASGIWLGINFWTTFIAGITMFKNLPRQQFGKLQAKLFPLYFSTASFCAAILLGTASSMGSAVTNKVMITLGVGLATSLLNLCVVEPVVTDNMHARYQLENSGKADAERRQKLKKQFGMLHGISSTINLANLVAVIAHCSWLGTLLHGAVL